MALTRRAFLGGVFALTCARRTFGDALEAPRVRFGFLSDAHINVAMPARQKAFEKALVRFAAENVDAVVCSGDLLDKGSAEEMELAVASWTRAFPDGCANDGRTVTPFFVWGNHDYLQSSTQRAMTPEQLAADVPNPMMNEKDRWWRELTGEDFPGEVYHRKICGVSFVGAHWGHEEEIVAWMTAHAGEVDAAHPFVYVQHPHPARTVCGDNTGSEVVRTYLERYPTCLSLSGHSHYSLTGEKAYWRGAFTALTGSVAWNHSAIVSVYPDRFVIAPYDERDDYPLPEWEATGLGQGSGKSEATSPASSLQTSTQTRWDAALASNFDSCDRTWCTSLCSAFTSEKAPGMSVMLR